MVPNAYRGFLVAAAGVAGALTGLLFVAISVRPEQIADDGDASLRFRPSSALAALVTALLVSMLALLPGAGLDSSLIVV